MPIRQMGSAAVATEAMPQSAVASSIERLASRLERAIALARIAAAGPEPEYGARYIVDAMRAVQEDLVVLRRASRSAP